MSSFAEDSEEVRSAKKMWISISAAVRAYSSPCIHQSRYPPFTHHLFFPFIVLQNARRRSSKKGVEHEDGRRRRTETTLQVRKDKKEDQLSKRRQSVGYEERGRGEGASGYRGSCLTNPFPLSLPNKK